MKRITIDLADEIYRELKMHCADKDVRMADVIRRLLEEYLRPAKKKKQ